MLRVENLCLEKGKKTILRGVTFHLEKGSLKCLIGLNGAGKTSLIECVAGIKTPSAGRILIDGLDTQSQPDGKRSLGYMPQNFRLFNDLTLRENLEYAAAVYGLGANEIESVLKMCHLAQQERVLAQNLSGGYRQLLSFAVAILHKPKLLILDEPTSAMDPLFRQKFWQVLHACHQSGTTVLVITHHVEELSECKEFLCLADGRIVYDGPLEAFKKDGFVDIKEVLGAEGER